MSKLNNAELDALSYEIRKKVNNSKKEEVAKENEEKLNAFYNTDLGTHIKAILDHADNEIKSIVFMSKVNKLAGIKSSYGLSESDVKRKLIIEQIECTNLEELIKKVTDSFLNTED